MNKPCFVIAEAGVNHNGDVKLAEQLIDVAKISGADAVKFQTFKADKLVGRKEPQYEMLKKLELSDSAFGHLARYAKEKKITFLSTPFDEESVDLLDDLGVPMFKIASGEITNAPLLRHIARKGKPVILSTGMATLREVSDALEVVGEEGIEAITLLHCVSAYPAKPEDMNLQVMVMLEKVFQYPVGLSDHSLGIVVPIAAAALGAVMIEKHFTLDGKMKGPDHCTSISPIELGWMVQAIRIAEKSLGDGRKRMSKDERANQKVSRRSIVANQDISAGTIISEGMLTAKRPAVGLSPKYLDGFIGRVAKVDIKQDELIRGRQFR